jgi:hypothetical protein
MAPKFGTSGLRGLVVDLTSSLVADYTRAFIVACESSGAIYVGRDLRPSSPEIADYVIKAASFPSRAETGTATLCNTFLLQDRPTDPAHTFSGPTSVR